MTPSFEIDAKNKSYRHQYANIYFTRLIMLKNAVEERARARWGRLANEPLYVARVLDIVKSQLCWVIGTVYMDMPLKPNVLEDIGRDHSIPVPPPREKFYCDEDSVMLEDESGRIKLVGDRVAQEHLVTGVIVAALGVETPTGDFEVVDLCTAGLASFAEEEVVVSDDMDTLLLHSSSPTQDEYVAIISGLSIGSSSSEDAQIQMLVEYLTGEVGGPEDQQLASQISRLIIAGNSLSLAEYGEDGEAERKPRKFGASAQAKFSPHPNIALSAHLHDLTSALPVHILPGADDPSGVILPQQPFPRAMFGKAASFEGFHCEPNPAWLRIRCSDEPESLVTKEGITSSSQSGHLPVTRSILVTSGQPILDMYKYLPTPPSSLVSIAASTLRWRHIAPTAPDTLWCHPYRDRDPFVLRETPDIYLVGGMPQFGTELLGSEDGTIRGRYCRIVLVPSFSQTGILVLVNLRTLEVRRVDFGVEGLSASGGEHQPSGEVGDSITEG
ncbi:hypothetical protein K503DRAFT_695182 [Rhizopogon vinicolor AM-OR11-026]|uniref:DNA-directed DNA polymerase n=1 Tax=Rhizopogon vinicolor AM-OR11-026 TaxID=1314800 RepID=A0A1B7MUZ9_9AGAM|nr:hypothetical protein K503DRAFT_695182 [Rhizopogon vinicolor AM-OR11-026]